MLLGEHLTILTCRPKTYFEFTLKIFMQMPYSEYARARLWGLGLKSLLLVRFLILVVRGTRSRARAHMQIIRERARAPTGEKVHKSNIILHALLKKSCKTGGMSFKFF